jgi:hypothetical protein
MKTMMVLFFFILMCLSGSAQDSGTAWLVTDEGKINCRKIVLPNVNNYEHAHIIFANGQRTIIDMNMISSFSMNGKIYTKLPLYKEGKATGKEVFMELIRRYGELCLYKYGMCKLETPDPKIKIYCYFLYEGTRLHMALNAEMLANIDKSFKRDCSFDY